MQNNGNYDKMYVMIADAQALTDNFGNIQKVRDNIIEVALDYLSVGLDPKKVTIFIQSMVPQLTEFTFYYMNLVTLSRLQRNPTVKTEIAQKNFGQSVPVGFLTHPISQAADITAFDANLVPVGEDQEPLVEQAREIVRKFNEIYGPTLVEPEAILPKNKICRRFPGIDGNAKMGKSLGNAIYLSDEPEAVAEKIKQMYTDPNHIKVSDPGSVKGNIVFIYLDAFCTDEHFKKYLSGYKNLDELKAYYKKGGLGDVTIKKFLGEILNEVLTPIREKRKELSKDKNKILEMLKQGSLEAEKVAAKNLTRLKNAMGINYFEENKL
jgi:tryptophanyl-tRNA synthetase